MNDATEAKQILLLLTLIAVFVVLFVALVSFICVYVYSDRVQAKQKSKSLTSDEKQNLEKSKSIGKLQNIRAAGKALISNKINNFQKKKSIEEGTKLIKPSESERSSVLTASTKDDMLSRVGDSPVAKMCEK